jgi:hypothetical protein
LAKESSSFRFCKTIFFNSINTVRCRLPFGWPIAQL